MFSHKVASKVFRANLEKFGQKSFAPPKICLLLHLSNNRIIRSLQTKAESMELKGGKKI